MSFNQGGRQGHQGNGGYNQGYQQGGYGGGRKRGRDDDQQESNARRRYSDNRGPGDFSSPRRDNGPPAGHVRKELWGLGAGNRYDPRTEIPELARGIQDQFVRARPLMLESFRVAITELPHKLPHYAALLLVLSSSTIAPLPSTLGPDHVEKPLAPAGVAAGLPSKPLDAPLPEPETEDVVMAEDESDKQINVGTEIILDLVKAFQIYLDERKWQHVRYCILFFAHLATLPTPLVTSTSVVALLSVFLGVLEEPGLRTSRGDECVRIIVEGLLRLGSAVEGTDGLRDGVQAYLTSRKINTELFEDKDTAGQLQDPLEEIVSTLSSELGASINVLPSIAARLAAPPETSVDLVPLDLPTVLVPPEMTDLEMLTAVKHAPSNSGLKGDEGVGYNGVRLSLKLFDDDSVPETHDPSGAVIRSLIHDIIDLYEVNRKECAKVLLELPQWFVPGTFLAKASKDDDRPEEPLERRDWNLGNLIVESILSSLFSLPKPHLSFAYYQSLLIQLCCDEPALIAPALGKCVRKLYAGLGDTSDKVYPRLDSVGIKRFSDWFAVHLSNFAFSWSWADWADDMELPKEHPKRVFIERTIELDVRLSYYDRIKGTIPQKMLEAGAMMLEAPGSDYAYDAAGSKYASAAESLLRLLRARGTISDVEDELERFQKGLETDDGLSEDAADVIRRDLAVQTVLQIGSRSFSHFLNVLERYLPLLHIVAPTRKYRIQLLHTVGVFHRRNPQFHLIVIDKLLQYRVVSALDVVAWVFSTNAKGEKRSWCDMDTFEALSCAVLTTTVRVEAAIGRIAGVRHEEESKAARRDDELVEDNEEIANAKSQLEHAEEDLADVIASIVGHFNTLLGEEEGEGRKWEKWWVKGWFREFCRSVAPALSTPSVKSTIASLALPEDSFVLNTIAATSTWSSFA